MKDVGVTTSRLSQVPGSRIASLLGQATRVSPRHEYIATRVQYTQRGRSSCVPSKRVQICEIRNPEDNVSKRPFPISL